MTGLDPRNSATFTIKHQIDEMLLEPNALKEIIEALRFHANSKAGQSEHWYTVWNKLDAAYHAALRMDDE